MADNDNSNGKLLAALAYAGFFVGFPTGLIPLFLRQDELSLHHGKVATVVWFGNFFLMIVATTVFSAFVSLTCGLGFFLFPLMFIPLIWGLVTSVHGIMLSLQGDMAEPIGGFGLGEMVFGTIKVQIPTTTAPSKPQEASLDKAAVDAQEEVDNLGAMPKPKNKTADAPVEDAQELAPSSADAAPPPPPAPAAPSEAAPPPPGDAGPPPPPLPDATDAPPPPPPKPPEK